MVMLMLMNMKKTLCKIKRREEKKKSNRIKLEKSNQTTKKK